MKKFWKSNITSLKFVFLAFLIWFSALLLVNYLVPHLPLPRRQGYNYTELKISNPVFFWNWANYDGIHYLDIARKGYGIYQQAFFPFYPNLIKFFTPLWGGKDLLSGIFISNFCLFFALFFLYKISLLDYKEDVARRAVLFLLLFPVSFFFSLVYTESLFLFLVLGSFYAARRGRWLLAAIFGAMASYTRLAGIFLFPALIYEWWDQSKKSNQKMEVKNLFTLFLIPGGLLYYMKFLGEKYHDFLMFIHVQPFFGAQRSGGKIILLYQVFWRYLKMILTTRNDPLYFAVWLELIVAIFFLTLIIFSLKRKLRLAYLIFAFLAYLTPTFSGSFSSMPRYVLTLFPCFIFLGTIQRKDLRLILSIFFGLLFVVSSVFFFSGYWVS